MTTRQDDHPGVRRDPEDAPRGLIGVELDRVSGIVGVIQAQLVAGSRVGEPGVGVDAERQKPGSCRWASWSGIIGLLTSSSR